MDESIYKDAKIVVVDDVEEVLNSTKNSLKFEGMNVETFINPLEALGYLKENKVDVLLLDFFMPQMNGDKFIEKLREFNQETVIILRTGYSDKVPPMQMLDSLNIQGYIDKLKGNDELIIMTKSAIKTAQLYKKTLEQEKKIDTLKYRNEFFGKFMYNVIGEARERFGVISTLVDTIANKNEREQYSEQEIEQYSNSVKTALHEFMECIEALEIEKNDTVFISEIIKKINVLFKTQLMIKNVELKFNYATEDVNSFAIFNGINVLVYILVNIIEHLLEREEKQISVNITKVSENIVEFKINNIITNKEIITSLKKLAELEEDLTIEDDEGIIIIRIINR